MRAGPLVVQVDTAELEEVLIGWDRDMTGISLPPASRFGVQLSNGTWVNATTLLSGGPQHWVAQGLWGDAVGRPWRLLGPVTGVPAPQTGTVLAS
jgi:hypothetical protein